MPIDYESLLNASLIDETVSYAEKDVILYALGIGFAQQPDLDEELQFVLERPPLSTVPTMASMLVPDALIENSGIDVSRLLHREDELTLHRPLPAAAKMLANQRIGSIADLGPRVGAEIALRTELRMARDDEVVATIDSRIVARGDGGFGGPPAAGRSRRPLPRRPADFVCQLATRRDQALLFRLNGDWHPLHVDPAVARAAGFDRPILHGRCTAGIACRAILKTVCGYDYTLIGNLAYRFRSPAYPGEPITTEMWQDGNVISFRCRSRDDTVIDNGRCTLNV